MVVKFQMSLFNIHIHSSGCCLAILEFSRSLDNLPVSDAMKIFRKLHYFTSMCFMGLMRQKTLIT